MSADIADVETDEESLREQMELLADDDTVPGQIARAWLKRQEGRR